MVAIINEGTYGQKVIQCTLQQFSRPFIGYMPSIKEMKVKAALHECQLNFYAERAMQLTSSFQETILSVLILHAADSGLPKNAVS